MKSHSESYKNAGVDVTAGYRSVELMKQYVKNTYSPSVLQDIGGFGGLFLPPIGGMEEPVLVSGTDGVGTKLKLAFLMDKHNTVGIDCVAMCVNDVLCSGAEPMFFLDYIATGKLIPEKVAMIVKGVTEGCLQSECALIGGETAEMPGFYPENEYDLAGFSVGIVDKKNIIDGSALTEGDVLVGLKSTGVHSNGFSLVRKLFGLNSPNATKTLATYSDELGETVGEALLRPTRIYVKTIKAIKKELHPHAISHVTGGGFYENIPRMLKEGTSVLLTKNYEKPPVFSVLQKIGDIPEHDMFNTFNMGIGMVIALPQEEADRALSIAEEADTPAVILGSVVKGDKEVLFRD